MTTIGPMMGASKQAVAGRPLEADAQRYDLTPETWALLGEEGRDLLRSSERVRRFLDVAEAFGIDPEDHDRLRELFDSHWSLKDSPSPPQKDPNRCDKEGFTPLHNAVKKRNYDVVLFLLLHDADPSVAVAPALSYHQVTSLGIRGRINALARENLHTGRNALTLAAALGADQNTIKLLAVHRVTDANGETVELGKLMDLRGETALTTALKSRNFDCVAQLLNLNLKVIDYIIDPRRCNAAGETPLALACLNGMWKATQQILIRGYRLMVDPSVPHPQGMTQEEIVKAQTEIRNAMGLLATHWGGLPEREAILGDFILQQWAGKCGVDLLFDEALKLIGSGPDAPDLLEQRKADQFKLGQRDYSLIEALLKEKAHELLPDRGQSLPIRAETQDNKVLAKLCELAGIRQPARTVTGTPWT
jgi:ankyrin repeat protein